MIALPMCVKLIVAKWMKWRSFGVVSRAALRRREAGVPAGTRIEAVERAERQPSVEDVRGSLAPSYPLEFDALVALGVIVHLLSSSPHRGQFRLSHDLPVEILPPLTAGQLRRYLDRS
jgi:hypothetical protein